MQRAEVLATVLDANESNWQDFAVCAQIDPELHYPDKGQSTREAKKICLSCDVSSFCLAYALENDEKFGVWGGLSEFERR